MVLMSEVGLKYDTEKPDWSLIDLSIVQQMAAVHSMGAQKYGRMNFMLVEPHRYVAALMRHLTAWQSGELLDEESGLHHLAHAMTNIHILMRLEQEGIKYDKGV